MSAKKFDKSLALLEKISGESLSLGRFLWAISPSMASKLAKLLGYSEAQFIRLAIQRELDKANLPFQVDVEDAA